MSIQKSFHFAEAQTVRFHFDKLQSDESFDSIQIDSVALISDMRDNT